MTIYSKLNSQISILGLPPRSGQSSVQPMVVGRPDTIKETRLLQKRRSNTAFPAVFR